MQMHFVEMEMLKDMKSVKLEMMDVQTNVFGLEHQQPVETEISIPVKNVMMETR
jgi:hypothetical protein